MQATGRKLGVGETYPGPAPGLQIRITARGALLEIANLKQWRAYKARAERRLGPIPDPPLAAAVQARQARAAQHLTPHHYQQPQKNESAPAEAVARSQ